MGWGFLGIMLSDRAEEKFDLVPTDEDKAKLREIIPTIRTVDRDDPSPIARGR